MFTENVLVSFSWDLGRAGNIEGLFICTREEYDRLAAGVDVNFGEALGKHSEVYGTIDAGDIKIVSSEQDKIDWLLGVIGNKTISGHNPLEYID